MAVNCGKLMLPTDNRRNPDFRVTYRSFPENGGKCEPSPGGDEHGKNPAGGKSESSGGFQFL